MRSRELDMETLFLELGIEDRQTTGASVEVDIIRLLGKLRNWYCQLQKVIKS